MLSQKRSAFCWIIALFLALGAARGASVTASLTGTFPIVGTSGQTISPAFGIQINISGSVPPNPHNPAIIVVCTVDTLHADGTLSCDTTQTIFLVDGHNYTLNKNDGTHMFPLTVNKTLVIAADVPCGATYNVSEHLSGNSGSGVDFGGGATFVDLPFAVKVDCQVVLGCTLGQGFWKEHPHAWPVTSLTLGSVTYNNTQLLSILGNPVKGNGLISLAYQLIAAKLNIANGADGSTVAGAISSADALIGPLVVPPVGGGSLDPSLTGSLNSELDSYNNGNTPGGPPHCQ